MSGGFPRSWRPGALASVLLLGCAHAAPGAAAPFAGTPGYPPAVGAALPMPPARYVEVTDPAEVVELVGSKAKVVARALREARARGDGSGARCLDESLSQIHAQARRAKEQADALVDAKRHRDDQAAHQHRVMLGIVLENAGDLADAAGRCSGAESAGPGAAVVVDVSDPPGARHAGL